MVHHDTIGYRIRLIHNQIHKQMEAKRLKNEGNLTGMQRWTMGFLRSHKDRDIYQRDIEAEFSISRATASNMLATMEKKGLIRREAVAHDARLKKLVLTEHAERMVDQAEQDVKEMEEHLVMGMTEEEIQTFRRLLDHVLENLSVQKPDDTTRCCGSEKVKEG